MLVTIRGQKGVTLDLFAEVTWAAALDGSYGSAIVQVPRDTAVWATDVIDENGGFLVEIINQFGFWRGVADRPRWRPAGMELDVHHVAEWVELRRVSPNRQFAGATAGQIVRRAVKDALVGLGSVPVTVGPILQAPPLIPLYEFARQTVSDVLSEMHERTGHIWWLDDDLAFHWGQRQGRYRETPVTDDGRLFQEIQPGTLSDVALEIIEVRDGGQEFSVRGNAPLLWPDQRIERV